MRAATGLACAEPTRWWTEPVDYPVRSWATAELTRVCGTAVDGARPDAAPVPWSVFVKTLRSPHQLRLPGALPAALRDRVQAMAAADQSGFQDFRGPAGPLCGGAGGKARICRPHGRPLDHRHGFYPSR